ncbi:sensor histidine kinase [Actinomycetota bacterium Odt1-20B]
MQKAAGVVVKRWSVLGAWPVGRRQRALDVVIALAIAAGGCVAGLQYHPAGWEPFDVWAVLLTCLVAAPIVWRRAAPLVVLAATCAAYSLYLGLGYQPTVNWFAPMVGLVSLAARRDLRFCAAGSLLTFAAILHSGLAGRLPLLMAVGQAALIPLIALFLGRTQRTLADRNHELRRLAQQLKHEREEHARRAVVDERIRIARELHDVVAHHMSVITVQAGLGRYVFTSAPDTAREALDNIADAGRDALSDLRRMLSVLRVDLDDDDYAPPPAPTPALNGLGGLTARVGAAGVDVELHTNGEPYQLSQGLELCAYRVVQEALTNALKHARGARVVVTVTYLPDELRITVCDDGSGTAESAISPEGSGHGLIGMRERARICGGTLSAGARREGGFEVLLSLPTTAVRQVTKNA